jgi:hypothetical protein
VKNPKHLGITHTEAGIRPYIIKHENYLYHSALPNEGVREPIASGG